MRIPTTINENTTKTYKSPQEQEGDSNNILRSGNFDDWDEGIPKSLQELCVQTIANNWQENPILEEIILPIDRCLLLELLPTDLPFRATVPKINDDNYWKRSFLNRWPKARPFKAPEPQISQIVRNGNNKQSKSSPKCSPMRNNCEKTWKEYFLEMYMQTYLEKLKPEDYNAEKMKELSELCESYVRTLILRELQSAADSSNHIPLNSVLGGFRNLTELSICFKQTYIGDKFDWTIVEIPLQDIRQFSRGLEKCKLMKILRIQNSNIDNDNVIIILKSLLKNEFLKILDLSHCQISDRGAMALSKFCSLSPLEDLILVNNKIGPTGIEALCCILHQETTNLKHLDLKLNLIHLEGGNILIRCLKTGAKLRSLSLNGCGLIGDDSNLLGEMLERNSYLEHLDMSNNNLGESVGQQILEGLQYNRTIRTLDIRMCGLGSKLEFEIHQKMTEIRKTSKKKFRRQKPQIIEPSVEFQPSEELKALLVDMLSIFEDTAEEVEDFKELEDLEEDLSPKFDLIISNENSDG